MTHVDYKDDAWEAKQMEISDRAQAGFSPIAYAGGLFICPACHAAVGGETWRNHRDWHYWLDTALDAAMNYE